MPATPGFINSRLEPTGNIKISGEAVSTDNIAAGEFLKPFKKLLMKAHIYPNRLFNVDETELYWKRMPD